MFPSRLRVREREVIRETPRSAASRSSIWQPPGPDQKCRRSAEIIRRSASPFMLAAIVRRYWRDVPGGKGTEELLKTRVLILSRTIK